MNGTEERTEIKKLTRRGRFWAWVMVGGVALTLWGWLGSRGCGGRPKPRQSAEVTPTAERSEIDRAQTDYDGRVDLMAHVVAEGIAGATKAKHWDSARAEIRRGTNPLVPILVPDVDTAIWSRAGGVSFFGPVSPIVPCTLRLRRLPGRRHQETTWVITSLERAANPLGAGTAFHQQSRTQPGVTSDQIASWRGTGTKTTGPFYVGRAPWKLRWRLQPNDYGIVFSVFVCRPGVDGVYVDCISGSAPGTDSSCIYETGDFYLKIFSSTAFLITVLSR